MNEDEARALWRRAAELQARAEGQEEFSLTPVLDEEHALTADEVIAAAEGAGIAAEHVRTALVERDLPGAQWRTRGEWIGLLRLLANYESDAIERTVLINAAPRNALESLAKLLSRPPYALAAEQTFEGDPLRRGVLVYRLSNPLRKKFGVLTGSAFERAINIADGKYLLVTAREVGENATRLSVRMPLYRRRENVALFSVFAGAAGLVGTTFASYIIPWTNTPSALSAFVPAVAGAVGIMTGAAIYRRVYRWATRLGEAALERMLQAISHDAGSTESPHVPLPKD